MTLNTADAVYVGDIAADVIYLGDTLVWEKPSTGGGWGPPESMLDPAILPVTVYTGDYCTGVLFTVVADGRITHLRSHNADMTGTAQLKLWDDATRTLLATVPVPLVNGWQDAELLAPVDVYAGKKYMVSFYSGANSTYPYQDVPPPSLSLNLIDMVGTYAPAGGYPDYDGDQYYWLDVVYQQAVGGGLYDPDTQAFLDASGLDESFAPALDLLVAGLKSNGLWAKMTAVYPFVGGTADLHKWNLMDPRDADDAYRLTYTPGSGSHSNELGYQPNIAYDSGGGYADTHLVPAGLLDPASAHLSLYSLTPLSTGNRCDFGAYNWDGTTNRFHLIVHYMSGEFYYSLGHAGMNNTPAGDGSGLFTSSRTSISEETAYLNGASLASNMTAGGVLPPVPLYIGCLNGFIDEFSNLPFGFVSIGAGLSANDNSNLYRVVQMYQTALGRQVGEAIYPVWSPNDIPGLTAWIDPAQDMYVEGERITSYREHSPNQRMFAGLSAGAEPVFRAGGAPYIEFQGGGHLQYDTWNAGMVGLTFVAVNSFTTPASPMMLVVHHSQTDGYEMRWDTMNMLSAATWQTNFVSNTHSVADGQDVKQYHAWRFDVSRQVSDAWVGQARDTFGATVMPNVPSYLFIGVRYGGYYYTGKVYEVLVFEGAVSDADLDLLREYLTMKHGL